jgi:hypothetical protein
MTERLQLRGKNALCSGGAALMVLLLMLLFFSGERFVSMVWGFMLLFLPISFFASVVGAFLSTSRTRWSLLLGALLGFAGGVAIVLSVVAGI